jgi:hypothetical protein
MFKKMKQIIKFIPKVVLFIIFQQVFIAHIFYFNDFFNLDLFNEKKLNKLNEEMLETKNIIKNLEDKLNEESNFELICMCLVTISVVLSLFAGYDYFTGGDASGQLFQMVGGKLIKRHKKFKSTLPTIPEETSSDSSDIVDIIKDVSSNI